MPVDICFRGGTIDKWLYPRKFSVTTVTVPCSERCRPWFVGFCDSAHVRLTRPAVLHQPHDVLTSRECVNLIISLNFSPPHFPLRVRQTSTSRTHHATPAPPRPRGPRRHRRAPLPPRRNQFLTFHLLTPSSPLQKYKVPDTTAYALITGSSAGIGLGIAQELVAQGFGVILHSRLPEELA